MRVMPATVPEWQHLAFYAVAAALLIMLLQRIPFVGRFIRFAFSAGLLAFLIFILLSQAPYDPLPPLKVSLPERKRAKGYVEPEGEMRYIPTPF
jgi:hypothetical protein